ncbi:dnaJ homolog subfamily C member 18-like [Ylistrum balloti]|uniref:dnaJ homolog subfamily C member 18-like n=1 Tax=Ylistrum balloti TaxID=509963 RepID=UPI002905DC47|nr:dnaJ homolog subfamily C member 18-like [Ylistrum balloti]
MYVVSKKGIPFLTVKMFRLQKLRRLAKIPKVHLEQASLYEVLGVGEDATSEEIKTAYFALSKKFHPDFNIDFDTKLEFMQVQNAYKILSSPLQRSAYDNASNSLSGRAQYHNIYSTHVHQPSASEHIKTPSMREQLHHFHHFNKHQASDPPPENPQKNKWEQLSGTKFITVISVMALSFSAVMLYLLKYKIEAFDQLGARSMTKDIDVAVSPLRARQEAKGRDIAKLKEFDIPRRDG